MTNKIQKVETEIMDCWRVVDDVDVLLQYFGDDEFFSESYCICRAVLGKFF